MHLKIILALLCGAGCALSTPTLIKTGSNEDEDLASVLHQRVVHQPEVFRHAVAIINHLETSPSCHRLAAKDLLQSCQSISSTSGQVETQDILDTVKSSYAARLAVCELNGAEVAVPPACLSMTPQSGKDKPSMACKYSGIGCSSGKESDFLHIGRKQVQLCLNALENRSQWWISYSNARQNAVTMCHAARAEIDREELLELYRTMSTSSHHISSALAQSASEALEHAKERRAFVDIVNAFQAQAISNMESHRTSLHTFLTDLTSQLEHTFSMTMDRMRKSTDSSTEAMEHLESKIGDSTKELDKGLTGIFDSVEERNRDMVVAHGKHFDDSQEKFVALKAMLDMELDSMRAGMEAMSQAFALYDDRFDRVNAAISNVREQALTIGESIQTHTEVIQSTSSLVTELNKDLGKLNLAWIPSLLDLKTCLRLVLAIFLVPAMHLLFGQQVARWTFFASALFLLGYPFCLRVINIFEHLMDITLPQFDINNQKWTGAATFCAVSVACIGCCFAMVRHIRSRRSRPAIDISTEDAFDDMEKKVPAEYHLPA